MALLKNHGETKRLQLFGVGILVPPVTVNAKYGSFPQSEMALRLPTSPPGISDPPGMFSPPFSPLLANYYHILRLRIPARLSWPSQQTLFGRTQPPATFTPLRKQTSGPRETHYIMPLTFVAASTPKISGSRIAVRKIS